MTTDWQFTLGLSHPPSAYQAALLDFVAYGKGNAIAVAVAGSGKSTSLKWAAKIAAEGLSLAFNKEAAEALAEKLEGTGMVSKTVHSHGFGAIVAAFGYRNVKVDANKYRDFVDGYIAEVDATHTLAGDDLTPAEIASVRSDGFPRSQVLKLLDLARLSLVDPAPGPDFGEQVLDLADHHNIDVDADVEQLVVDVVRLAMQWGAENPRIVDFTDMVWLPSVVVGLRPKLYRWIFVDEAQDISRAHRELIRRSLTRDGRALFVGDPKQAIYGFAGADAASFAAIVDEFSCTELPLSVCYRCPTSVLDLARELCPQIEAREGAPEGVVRSSTLDAFVADAQRGDMVLCRLNAPLMSIAFRLIGAGVSAAVRGRADLGKGLIKVIDVAAKGRSFDAFDDGLDAWQDREQAAARKRYGKRSEDALAAKLEAIADQAECVRVILASSGAKSASELRSAVDSLFADKDPKVVLSSVHRAKGLEAPRVFIAKPERLGKAWPNSREWMVEQEKNLFYVALTRSQGELVFLDGVPAKREEPIDEDDFADAAPVEGYEDPDPVTAEDYYMAAAAAHDRGDRDEADRLLRLIPASDPTPCRPIDDDPIVEGILRASDCEGLGVPKPPLGPAPLPPVDADAPDTYDPEDRSARVALARRLDAYLRAEGFAPRGPDSADRSWGTEVIYQRARAGVVCKVASTIVGGEVRDVGKDSIKVSLVRDGRGIGKARRVNRVGKIEAIVERVGQRIAKLTERDGPAYGLADDGEDDGSPALLPGTDSLRRAAQTLATGHNFMRPGEYGDADIADAYEG